MAGKDSKLEEETAALRAEVDSATREMNGVLEDRYQLQVALKAAQKQVANSGNEARDRMKELEGALKQAAKDFQVWAGLWSRAAHASCLRAKRTVGFLSSVAPSPHFLLCEAQEMGAADSLLSSFSQPCRLNLCMFHAHG